MESQKPFVWAVSYQNVQQVYVPKVFKNKIWYFIAGPDWLLHFAEALAGELDFEEALQRASQMTQGGRWPWRKERENFFLGESRIQNPKSRFQNPESRFQKLESKSCALLLFS